MRARILDIYAKYGEYIEDIVPLKIEDEYMKVITTSRMTRISG